MIIKINEFYNLKNKEYEYLESVGSIKKNRIYIVANLCFDEESLFYRLYIENVDDYISINKTCMVPSQACEIIHSGLPTFWDLFKDSTNFCNLLPPNWFNFDSNEYSSYFDFLAEDPEGQKMFEEDTKKLFEMHSKDFDVDKILEGVVIEGDDYSEIMK